MKTAFAFDLDGTITNLEILPLIASEVGLNNELKQLTKLTLDGTIEFEASFRLRCAILRSIPISKVRALVENVPFNQTIGKFITENKERCFIVTGNLDVWIQPLVERLGCKAFTSIALMDGDQLIRPEKILSKNQPLVELRRTFERTVAIGDSVNDIPMFETADIGIAFGGVHPPSERLVELADYVAYDGDALCRLLSTL